MKIMFNLKIALGQNTDYLLDLGFEVEDYCRQELEIMDEAILADDGHPEHSEM